MALTVTAARRGLLQPFLVAAATLAGAAYVGAVDPNQPGHYPACPFRYVTGYYCPGCGTTRAVHALANGNVLEALHRNPLAVAAVPFLVLAWIDWARRSVTGAPRRWTAPPWVMWTLLVVLVVFGVLRNLPGFAWLAP